MVVGSESAIDCSVVGKRLKFSGVAGKLGACGNERFMPSLC